MAGFWRKLQLLSEIGGQQKKLSKGLLNELEDINDQLNRVIKIHSRQLQIFSLKGMEAITSLPIQNFFFKHYFKDAFPHLNREQRISYQLIHASLEELNRKNEDLYKFVDQYHSEVILSPNDDKTLQIINSWGDRVIVLYKTAVEVRWHILYHLKNSNYPTFDFMGPMHESCVKFCRELDENVKVIIEEGKTLKRKDFETIYDPSKFGHN
ncbi:MAG: hypothetical protein ACU84H_13515 [Gammaproteobacteria bacterium]